MTAAGRPRRGIADLMTTPFEGRVCPDCREIQRQSDDPHGSGCRYDVGRVPTGLPYRVTMPDGTTREGVGRHRRPSYVLVYANADGFWRMYSSHTTVEAARWAMGRIPLPDVKASIVDVDP